METYIAKTFFGLEPLLAQELEALGVQKIEVLKRAVQFEADERQMYLANLVLRTALRVIMPLTIGEVRSAKDLYDLARTVNWGRFFTNNRTFAIDSVVSEHPAFNHTNFVSLTVKDAVVDQFRELRGGRPDVDKEYPDVRIQVHIHKERCTLSLDCSGESLHRRGYRQTKHEAPLNELLAAALVKLSGWQAGDLLVDPMCGSGTIAIEAAMAAMQVPANALRAKFGFMYWRDYDAALWKQVRAEAMNAIQRVPEPLIRASDKSIDTVREAEANAARAGVGNAIRFKAGDFFELEVPNSLVPNKYLLFNPPYNERLQLEDTQAFYKAISDCMKREYQGYTAFVLSPNEGAAKAIRLAAAKKWDLFNGSIPCKLLKYELYGGSRR